MLIFKILVPLEQVSLGQALEKPKENTLSFLNEIVSGHQAKGQVVARTAQELLDNEDMFKLKIIKVVFWSP